MHPATKSNAPSKFDGAFLVSLLLPVAILAIKENTLFTFKVRYCRFIEDKTNFDYHPLYLSKGYHYMMRYSFKLSKEKHVYLFK